MLVCALLVHIAHETAGAARIRHSLRPLFIEGEEFPAKLGRNVPRECGVVFEWITVIARSPCDDAIHSFLAWRDGLLRFARNDGFKTLDKAGHDGEAGQWAAIPKTASRTE